MVLDAFFFVLWNKSCFFCVKENKMEMVCQQPGHLPCVCFLFSSPLTHNDCPCPPIPFVSELQLLTQELAQLAKGFGQFRVVCSFAFVSQPTHQNLPFLCFNDC